VGGWVGPGDCTDHFGQWTEFTKRAITTSFQTLASDSTSFLSLDACKAMCESFATAERYYRDYQCSGTLFACLLRDDSDGILRLLVCHLLALPLILVLRVLASLPPPLPLLPFTCAKRGRRAFFFFLCGGGSRARTPTTAAISYRPQYRVYGVDYSATCELIQYWGEPQLGPASKSSSFYTRDLGHCHDGALVGDSCYRLSEDSEGAVSWEAAASSCAAWGGYLVVLDDADEATMLASTLRPADDVARWIGLSSEGDCGGAYHWVNNARVDMTQPFLQFITAPTTDGVERDAHCVSVHENGNKHVGKKIEDRSCATDLLAFACEKDMPPPEVDDLSSFSCPAHTLCNNIGQYEVSPGNWANDTVCGCAEGCVFALSSSLLLLLLIMMLMLLLLLCYAAAAAAVLQRSAGDCRPAGGVWREFFMCVRAHVRFNNRDQV
jgi:hypothetical protein